MDLRSPKHRSLQNCIAATATLGNNEFWLCLNPKKTLPQYGIRMLIFNRKFFCYTLLLFLIELTIALYVHDSFVRPYVGDYLVVFLIYCAVRTLVNAPVVKIAVGVMAFSYLVEILQYFQLVRRLGLEHNTVVRTVIGYGFEWKDILAYTLGVLTILVLERKHLRNRKPKLDMQSSLTKQS